MHATCKRQIIMACALLMLPLSNAYGEGDKFISKINASVAYDTRYIGSGRNNSLGNGGHYKLNAYAVTKHGFTLDFWQSFGSQADIDETNITLTLEKGNEYFSVGGGYRYYYVNNNEGGRNSNGDELLFYVNALKMPFTPQLSYLHSAVAGGGALRLSAYKTMELESSALNFTAELGYDNGYVSESSAFSHMLIKASWSKPITEDLNFSIFISQVLALKNLQKNGDTNWTYGGVSLSTSF